MLKKSKLSHTFQGEGAVDVLFPGLHPGLWSARLSAWEKGSLIQNISMFDYPRAMVCQAFSLKEGPSVPEYVDVCLSINCRFSNSLKGCNIKARGNAPGMRGGCFFRLKA